MPVNPATAAEASDLVPTEQRSSNRISFRQSHRIAPYAGGPLPADDAFFAVTFSDISQGGFSFVADELPDYETMIVAMPVHNEVIYVQARIIDRRVKAGKNVIGCQFGEKVSLAETK